MENAILGALGSYWWVGAIILLLIFWKAFLWLFGILIIPQNGMGIVNKKFALVGSHRSLPDGKIIALSGEAGIQADTLAPGIYFGYWPWQYQVSIAGFTTIEQGQVGVVEAKDGFAIPSGRVLGKEVDCDSFQNARAFLTGGGERGPQLKIIAPGTFRINTAMFTVSKREALQIDDNMVGIVTTREGQPLPTGDIAGKEIPGHLMFQDPQKFIDNGGFKGLQEQVMLAGLYYVNPLFVTVEPKGMTEVPIGSVGVVVAYVGDEYKPPQQAPGSEEGGAAKDRQIRVVPKGFKGVWSTPLDPGKYPINPYTNAVQNVPTTNIVLNWADAKTEAHELDKNLSTIKVRSQDGFTYNLDVSQIIHIPRENAPKVIARFGTMMNLVTQVLEPSIGNYFRNSAQEVDVIEFLKGRAERQKSAKGHIEEALKDYDVQAVDTLIGDIATPEALMKTLTDRKIADQEILTYGKQKEAQDARTLLTEATAMADTKAEVVASLRRVEIENNLADSMANKARGEASMKTTIADADAHVFTVTGNAEATKIKAVGSAEAEVLQKKVEAVGKEGYVGMQVATTLSTNHIQLVPNFLVQGGPGDGKGGNTLVEGLLAMMVAQGANSNKPSPEPAPKAA